ncbi:hypothetical protein GYMLUDRAFT_263869 [Collybiopsis luxurians FD-317 M1]|uniref:Unplaced genomic scaffold GYMLUscaffold_52, whole genome shotgun sequence n=1 Tax=Collybiopsis luxurians FD-317 M1 TaxID=944289 RepID=A0A0D0AZN4_9AGAR|nr:hypothetical protein GYMLUDRAFT_263869 [Collybiopsis luxurians FD-317 M1]
MASFLDITFQNIDFVDSKILTARSRISQVLLDAQRELALLYHQKRTLEEQAQRALGEQAPIRNVPLDILREVFLQVSEDDPKAKAGWLFAAVCRRWRALALETPRLWTRIRLVTSLDQSADVVRLWLERAGPTMPLDIEIYLRVPQAKAAIPAECSSSVLTPATSRRPRRRVGTLSDDATYAAPIGNGSEAWGHVAVFYLKQQMPRWKRFVFRYDRVFSSLSAFKAFAGNAPNLQEFEISCIEPGLLSFSDWSWNSTSLSFPALQRIALTNTAANLSSSLLSQPLRSIYISGPGTNPIPISHLMQTLATHAPNLITLSLHLPIISPPVVPANALPYSSNVPLCFPVLEELSLGGHYLMAQLASAITTPSLEELNVDIDLGRGGVGPAILNANGAAGGNYIEDVVHELLCRGTPAPIDKLKALSIGFGFGNGRRATRDRESDLYLRAVKSAQACSCTGTTFLPPNHPATPSSFSPSVVHMSWGILNSLPALESLKVGLGGNAGQAWTTNGNATFGSIGYLGGASDLQNFLNSLCLPDDDYMTGTASIGAGPGPGNIAFALAVPPLTQPGNMNVINLPPPPPAGPFQPPNFNAPGGIAQGIFGLAPIPPPPGALPGGPGYIPPAPPMFGNNITATATNLNSNGWVLPNLTELGIKVGSAAFLPQSSSNGSNGGMLYPYAYPPIVPYSAWDDPTNHPGAGHVRRLLDVIDARNPKAGGRGPSVEGVVPERLKRIELVLNVVGVPGRGNVHAGSLLSTKEEREEQEGETKKDKGKKKADDASESSEEQVGSSVQSSGVDVQIQEMVDAISAVASGSLNTAGQGAKKDDHNHEDSSASRVSNPAATRNLVGKDSVSWMEERVEDVDMRCECLLWDGPGTGFRW